MPKVTIIPITILLFPSFKVLSFTLEQNIPTKMTDNRLQDLTITTAGKEASFTAWLYVHMFKLMIKAQMVTFLKGMLIGYTLLTCLLNSKIKKPIMAQTTCEKKVKMMGASN